MVLFPLRKHESLLLGFVGEEERGSQEGEEGGGMEHFGPYVLAWRERVLLKRPNIFLI